MVSSEVAVVDGSGKQLMGGAIRAIGSREELEKMRGDGQGEQKRKRVQKRSEQPERKARKFVFRSIPIG